MTKITCDVAADLLPLYLDEVVSEDTKKLIEEHLTVCASCRDALAKMAQRLNLPPDGAAQAAEAKAMANAAKRFRLKKQLIAAASTLAAFGIAAVLCLCAVGIKSPVAYDAAKMHIGHGTVKGSGTADSFVILTYDGRMFDRGGMAFQVTDPDGTLRQIYVTGINSTFWANRIAPLFDNDTSDATVINLAPVDKYDRIYYGDIDAPRELNTPAQIAAFLKECELIWEKEP